MADFNVTECVIENVNGAAFLRPQKSYSIAIAGTSTTSSIPISANTQVVRLATPSSCHFRLGAGATTSDAMIPAGEVVDFSVQPDGGTSYLSVIEASSPTDIGGGGVGDSGLESVNVQTLAGNKTITSTDARVQLLNPGGAVVRTITLDSSLHVVGTKVTICNTDSLDGAYNYGSLHVVNSVAVGLHSQDLLYGGSESWVYTGTGATGWVRVTGVPGGQSYVGTIILGNQAFYVQNFTVTGNQLGIGGSPSSLFHVTAAGNANALRVDNTTGYTGIGMAPGTEQLSFAGNGRQLGANLYVSDITTASANKAWNLRGVNYASSTNFNLVGYNATNAAIVIQYGAAEAKYVLFYADSVSSFRIVDRNVGVGVADPSSLFHVTASGNANALRVDNTTGHVGIGMAPSTDFGCYVNKYAATGYTLAVINGADGGSAAAGIHLYSKNGGGSTTRLEAYGSDATIPNVFDLLNQYGPVRVFSPTGKYIHLGPANGGVSINDVYAAPNASAILDLDSTTKGFGLPIMTTTQRDAISTPKAGLMIYNSTTTKVEAYAGGAWTALH